MKIDYRTPKETADISASKGSDFIELAKLSALAIATCIVLYFVTGIAVDFAVSRITIEQEQAMFASFDLSDEGVDDEESLQKLTSILQRLKLDSHVPNIDYNLVIMDEDSPNAFAFPGGTIGVTTGLLQAVDGDIELAFVLGHELGHFAHRDHLVGIGRAISFSILYSLIIGSQMGADAISTLPILIMSSNYSQGQESKADEFSLELLNAQYGTTQNFEALFSVLEDKQSSSRWDSMLSTHPQPAKRIARLRDYVELHFTH